MKNENEVTGSDRLIDAVTLEHAIGHLTELRAKNLHDREVWEDIDATIKGLQALPRPEGQLSRAAIEAFVETLFTDGSGVKADRLVLTLDLPNRSLGGWCRGAIVDRVQDFLAASATPRESVNGELFHYTYPNGERVIVRHIPESDSGLLDALLRVRQRSADAFIGPEDGKPDDQWYRKSVRELHGIAATAIAQAEEQLPRESVNGELLEALRELRSVVQDTMLPELNRNGGDLWLSDEFRFHATAAKVDAAIKRAEEAANGL